MSVLRLLSRVAFICNICWLLASFLQRIPDPPKGELVSMVIVLGYLLSIFLNALVNIWVLGALAAKKLQKGMVPAWLMVVNGLFFIVQLYLLIISR